MLSNHGLDETVIDTAFRMPRNFFDLPTIRNRAYRLNASIIVAGMVMAARCWMARANQKATGRKG